MARFGMVIDTRQCVGCMDCVVACKTENDVPDGHCRSEGSCGGLRLVSSARARLSVLEEEATTAATAAGGRAAAAEARLLLDAGQLRAESRLGIVVRIRMRRLLHVGGARRKTRYCLR